MGEFEALLSHVAKMMKAYRPFNLTFDSIGIGSVLVVYVERLNLLCQQFVNQRIMSVKLSGLVICGCGHSDQNAYTIQTVWPCQR
jgi:hypothetical protein